MDISYVDLVFPLKGDRLPLDNGYLIYSALSNLCPNLHQLKNIGIHPIAGIPKPLKQLRLTRRSQLKIRILIEQIPQIYEFLTEQSFRIHQKEFHLGIPQYQALTPSPNVYSRIVTIRRCLEPEQFIKAAQSQLEKLGIQGNTTLLKKKTGQLQCRQMTIKKSEGTFPIRGYGVRVTDLNDEDSIRLQQQGIGGKRKMMCGIFVPSYTQNNELIATA